MRNFVGADHSLDELPLVASERSGFVNPNMLLSWLYHENPGSFASQIESLKPYP